jgi:hypothetical protein
MNNLQEGVGKRKEFKLSRFIIVFHLLNLVLILSNFSLNFLGRPELKYVYLVHVVIIFLSIIIFPIEKILPEIITMLFLEGQGRVIWDYQAWARIIFDLILVFAVLKIFIANRKIYSKQVIPKAFVALILCHVLWYMVQIFNINSASIIGAVAAAKIYLFPIFLFFALSQVRLDVKGKDFTFILNFFILVFSLELLLNIFQMQEKQSLVLKISPFYFKAMQNGVFSGNLYRPFATTFIPGGLSTLIYLTVGLLFFKKSSFKYTITRFFIIGLSIVNLVLNQVRSALIKYILILIAIHVGTLIYHRLSTKKLIPYILILSIIAFNLENIIAKLPALNDKNLEYAIARTTALADTSKLTNSRISTNTLGEALYFHLSRYPMGVGPAMTGAASSINEEALAHDPVINSKSLWTHDNLIVSLVIELGYGAIFYIILIGLIPIYFIQKLIKLYRDKKEEKFLTTLICASALAVIIIGNWGAVAITYNPESFIYWFFAAIGFNTLADQRQLI